MDLKLRPIDFESLEDFEKMIKWYRDDEIRHLFTVDFNKGPTLPMDPFELRKAKMKSTSISTYMIEIDGQVVGDASIDTAFHMLMGAKEHTGWLGICIGEKPYRGRGLGYEVMHQLEEICAAMGLTRLELGVFAYNESAIHIYKKLGYKHFCTVENFTWYNSEWHDDYRMEKYLKPTS